MDGEHLFASAWATKSDRRCPAIDIGDTLAYTSMWCLLDTGGWRFYFFSKVATHPELKAGFYIIYQGIDGYTAIVSAVRD